MTEGQENEETFDGTQVVYAALSLTAQISSRLTLNLKDIKRLVEVACFHEARRRGLKLREIADKLGVSQPKVGLLSKQFKDHFSKAESDSGLPRRILMVLWAEEMTRPGLARALAGFDEDEVSQALDKLVSAGRVRPISGRTTRYEVMRSNHRMVDTKWLARLDAISDMMTTVAKTVERRIFDKDPRAFARAIQVDVLPEDIDRLNELYQNTVFPLLSEINERAGRSEDAVKIRFSIMWAPEDSTLKIKEEIEQ
jgi:hypothetical protein